jgi:SAM-dependent methyltransferase
MAYISFLLGPEKFRHFSRWRFEPIDILDVGCGNGSPSLAKEYFPHCNYTGIDVEDPAAAEINSIDTFVKIDLNKSELSSLDAKLIDNSYDLIIISHVIEHLYDVEVLLKILCAKLRPNSGCLFIEFPSVRSLALPSMEGTLHFCDDATHVRVYSVLEISNVVLSCGCRVLFGGRRRNWLLALLSPFIWVCKVMITKPKEGKASAFWDLLGFADIVIARKNEK